LRFGPLDVARNRRILQGWSPASAATATASAFPTVGGEVMFDESYSGNPLVNVFCLGIAKRDALVKGIAGGIGNPIYYVGAKTGRDGIHGATMASAEFDEKSAEKRPAVQVGDPFMEKLLLEAVPRSDGDGRVRGRAGHGRRRPDVRHVGNRIARRRGSRD
jgi:phosphoribosylformylglycinamidine synthase